MKINNKPYKSILLALILLLLFSTSIYAKDYPEPTDEFFANDYANVLDQATEAYINAASRALEDATEAQVVVVTVPEIKDQALEEYSLGLLREWGIGDAQKNNGVLILLDIGGRSSRIEVGYGLEGALPDGKTGRIQDDYMVPYFKEGDYDTGITEGYNAILNQVYLEYGLEEPLPGQYNVTNDESQGSPITGVVWVIVVIVLIFLDFRFTGGALTFMIIRGIGRGGGGSGGGGRGGGFGGGGSGGGGGSSRGW